MNTLFAIIGWAIFGLVAGAVARLLVPGRQPMSLVVTMVLGILGSMAGGFLSWLVVGGEAVQSSGFIMSIIGAIVVLALYIYTQRKGSRSYE